MQDDVEILYYVIVSQIKIKKAVCMDATRIPFFQGRSVIKFVTVFHITQVLKRVIFRTQDYLIND
jgi:hypothetical protein